MSAYVTFDEFHLVLLVPIDLDDEAREASLHILASSSFRSVLQEAVVQVLRQYTQLEPVRLRSSD